MSRLLGHSVSTLVVHGARHPGRGGLVMSRSGGGEREATRAVQPDLPTRERWQRALLCALVDPDRPARFGPG